MYHERTGTDETLYTDKQAVNIYLNFKDVERYDITY